MKGQRPKQPHLAEIYDEYEAVGRTDVSDLLQGVLDKIPAAQLMFPDLYVHKLTEALIRRGLLPPA